MATLAASVELKPNDFKGKVDPDWCPGCGDFGALKGLQKACADLGLRSSEILVVSGIGCSSNLPGFFNAYGMHTLQSTPFGNVEMPVNPITTAIMNGSTFVARGFSGDTKHLADLVKKGIQHKGFALIDVFSPCVTFNHDNTYTFFRNRIKKLGDEFYEPIDWKTACEKAMIWDDTVYTGLFFQNTERPSLDQLEPVLQNAGPLARREPGLNPEQARTLITEIT